VRPEFGALSGAGLLYALAANFSGQEQILWCEKISCFGSLLATFVNLVSFAPASAGLVVTTGQFLAPFEAKGGTEWGPWARLPDLPTFPLKQRCRLLILAWVTIASTLQLTKSPRGFFAGSVGLCVLLADFALRRSSRLGLAFGAVAPVPAVGIGLFFLGGGATDALEGNAAAREAIAELPLIIWGHSSFADVFGMVGEAEVPQDVTTAYNSALAQAPERGVSAALLVLAFITLFLRCLTSVRGSAAVYACEVGATVLIAALSAVGFSLQIPAVAANYTCIISVAVAQS
jgi:hypothetical protein